MFRFRKRLPVARNCGSIGEVRRVSTGLPKRVISWYGDDFTGSTDALEALAPHMPSVLFLGQPDEKFFSQFAEYAAFGLAGSSRSESPDWMDTNLVPAFEWLDSLGTAVCHYKVCSTFDSSPKVGNIGRAVEIGKRVFSFAVRTAGCGRTLAEALYGVWESVRCRGWGGVPDRSTSHNEVPSGDTDE